MIMLEEEFLQSLLHYTVDPSVVESYWHEIVAEYSNKDRHYHNLTHLYDLFAELHPLKEKFSQWEAVIFALVYHDIVYNTLKSNNEERSAGLAVKRLTGWSCPKEVIDCCSRLIRATKHHQPADYETNLFTDADLAILGASPERYREYADNVRREYSLYPDLLYNPGRKKVLRHFLEMERIYKTEEFRMKYETQARANLEEELGRLGNQ